MIIQPETAQVELNLKSEKECERPGDGISLDIVVAKRRRKMYSGGFAMLLLIVCKSTFLVCLQATWGQSEAVSPVDKRPFRPVASAVRQKEQGPC